MSRKSRISDVIMSADLTYTPNYRDASAVIEHMPYGHIRTPNSYLRYLCSTKLSPGRESGPLWVTKQYILSPFTWCTNLVSLVKSKTSKKKILLYIISGIEEK